MGDPVASRADVARFFGRMAFGATNADLDLWTGRPYAELVDSLVVAADPALRAAQPDEAVRLHNLQTGGYNLPESQRWWLERMRRTPFPVEERMTLFWHDHFATSYKPEPFMRAMLLQNQTLRVHALGNFRTLLNAVTIDPAMLQWLNGTQNYVRDLGGGNYEQHINENYGREFFELFTLGLLPQVFSEDDVREAARAFTGWRAVVTSPLGGTEDASRFYPELHDHGVKRVLRTAIGGPGAVEELEYRRVADAALARREAAYFLAYKVVQNFGYDPLVVDGNIRTSRDPLIEAVATSLRATGWDIRSAVLTMVRHDGWRYATRRRPRMPVELVVHLCKVLGVPGDENTFYPQPFAIAETMGQALFQPPNVSGWPTGRAWLSQSKLIARYDLTAALLGKSPLRSALPQPDDLTGWCNLLGLDAATLSGTARDAVGRYLDRRAAAPAETRQAGVLSLLVSSPDWQVM